MSISMFADKAHRPNPDEMLAPLGAACSLWEGLAGHLAAAYRASPDLGYYGKNYGWAERYRKSGKALVSLYPGEGCFTAQIVLRAPEVETALSRGVGPAVREAIERANPYPEGRWLFIRVADAAAVAEIQELLAIKAGRHA